MYTVTWWVHEQRVVQTGLTLEQAQALAVRLRAQSDAQERHSLVPIRVIKAG